MTKEQVIERLKRKILLGKSEKNIGIPVYISELETVLSMLKEKDKQIDLMAERLRYESSMQQEFCIDICEEKECNIEKCKERIKQYFENKAKELLNK